jgi:hypothetical protein
LRSITYDPKGDTMEDVEGVEVDHNDILKISSEACNTKFVFLIYALLAGNGRRPSAFPVNEELVPYPYKPKVILQNLILAVSEVAKKNQEKVRELDFALRLSKPCQMIAIIKKKMKPIKIDIMLGY